MSTPTLDSLWMPFTPNRQFKAKPRILAKAAGMHYWTDDGRQILFALTRAGLAMRKARTHLKRTWLSGALAQLTQGELRALLAAAEPMRKLANS